MFVSCVLTTHILCADCEYFQKSLLDVTENKYFIEGQLQICFAYCNIRKRATFKKNTSATFFLVMKCLHSNYRHKKCDYDPLKQLRNSCILFQPNCLLFSKKTAKTEDLFETFLIIIWWIITNNEMNETKNRSKFTHLPFATYTMPPSLITFS